MRARLVGLALVGFVQAAGAGDLDRAWLRGSQPYGPGTPNVGPPPVGRPHPPPPPPESLSFEVGTRFGVSTGRLAKDLYDDPRLSNVLNSRLTYDGLRSGTFEAYGRIDTLFFGTFVKGYVGMSGLNSGTLKDEDFPPNLVPYSATLSQQSGGRLSYATVDLGQIVVTTDRTRGSFLLGYGHLGETVNAYGCNQIAGNPQVCVPSIPTSVLAITEDSSWDFVRLGFLGEFRLLDRLTLSGEVAWLPFVQMGAHDTHWLRTDFAGPVRESASGPGVQIETILSYQVTDCFNVGLGGRYWHLQTRGEADLEQAIIGLNFPPASQPLTFKTTRFGGFVQGAYRFGPF